MEKLEWCGYTRQWKNCAWVDHQYDK